MKMKRFIERATQAYGKVKVSRIKQQFEFLEALCFNADEC